MLELCKFTKTPKLLETKKNKIRLPYFGPLPKPKPKMARKCNVVAFPFGVNCCWGGYSKHVSMKLEEVGFVV